jgi:hypothetical protein
MTAALAKQRRTNSRATSGQLGVPSEGGGARTDEPSEGYWSVLPNNKRKGVRVGGRGCGVQEAKW